MGGLVLCSKIEEADEWQTLAEAAGRSEDVIRITLAGPYRLNLLDYENSHSGANTESIVELLLLLAEVANGGERRQDEWQDFARTNLRNAVDLLRLAGEPIEINALFELATKPKAFDLIHQKAKARQLSDCQADDLAVCADYWARIWPTMPSEMRSRIEGTVRYLLDPLLRGEMRELFSTDTTITPEATFAGKIIVVDLPTQKSQIFGKLANVAWKLAWQSAIERRGSAGVARPAFLWANSYQKFATSNDGEFCRTARIAGGLMVLLTNGVSALSLTFGCGEEGRASVGRLLGNFSTQIFCRNWDMGTNKWAKELIGRRSEQRDFIVEENYFTSLSSGGPKNNCVVTAVLYTGRPLPPFAKMCQQVAFKQS